MKRSCGFYPWQTASRPYHASKWSTECGGACRLGCGRNLLPRLLVSPMLIRVPLKYAEVRYQPGEWLCSVMNDGSTWGAHPHRTPHYHVVAHRAGYGDDLWRYCFEHEVCHHFVPQWIGSKPSAVITALAHGQTPDTMEAVFEEAMVLTFQRWLRANERPIMSGVDWDEMKAAALALLEG